MKKLLFVLPLMTALVAAPAFAAKPPAKPVVKAPVEKTAPADISSAPAFKPKEAGDIVVRLRGLGVMPFENGEVKSAAGAPLGLNDQIDQDWVPELDISYFFTKNIAAELVLATTRHTVTAIPAAGGAGVPVGKVSLLPPTLTAQYHFMPESRFSPYVGAGINYTIFYGEDAAGGTITSTAYDDSFGYALQAGFDYAIADRWFLNFDFKKIFLDTTINGDGTVGKWQSKVDIDPILVGFGVGYRF